MTNKIINIFSKQQERLANESFRDELRESFVNESRASRSQEISVDAKDLWAKIVLELPKNEPKVSQDRFRSSALALSCAALVLLTVSSPFFAKRSNGIPQNPTTLAMGTGLDQSFDISLREMSLLKRSESDWNRSSMNLSACNPLKQSCLIARIH